MYVVLYTKVDFLIVVADNEEEAREVALERLRAGDRNGHFHIDDVQTVPDKSQ